MVRNASGALSKAKLLFQSDVERGTETDLSAVLGLGSVAAVTIAVDALLEDRGRLEHHHAARRDRHLGAGLGIAADALALLAHHEGAERGELHRLAALEAVGDLLQHEFHKGGGFGAREADLLIDGFAEVDPRDGLCSSFGHRPGPTPANNSASKLKG